MMLPIFLFSALIGFCLTPYRRPIFGGDPNTGPGPDPIRRIYSDPMSGIWGRIIGMLGGIAAGTIIHFLLPSESFATVGLAAWAGGAIFFDTASRFAR
jgi:hypothetical protein